MIISKSNEGLIPVTIASCTLWLDANDSSTITQSSGLVSVWADKSGQNNDATQGTGANQPFINSRTVNGLNVLDFQNNQWLQLADNNVFDNPFTLFIVAAADDISQQDTFISRQQGAAVGGFAVRCNGDSTNFTAFAVGAASTFSTVNISGVNTSTNIHRVSFNGATSYSINNNSASSAGAVTYSNAAVIPAGIGAALGGTPTSFLDGLVAEVVMYSRILSASEILSINQYLSNKWGVALV